MSSRKPFSPVPTNESTQPSANKQQNRVIRRRSFLKGLGVSGAAITAGALLGETSEAASGPITLPSCGFWLRPKSLRVICGDHAGAHRFSEALLPACVNHSTHRNPECSEGRGLGTDSRRTLHWPNARLLQFRHGTGDDGRCGPAWFRVAPVFLQML